MKKRDIALFTGGVLTGAVLLYVLLWSGGVFSPYLERVRAQSNPDVSAPGPDPVPPPASTLPAPRVPPSLPPSGESDRMMTPDPPPPRRVIAPIDNLQASNIHDMFDEGRSGGRAHEAIDIMAPRGTPVRAMVDGEIKKLFTSDLGGLTIYQFDETQELCYYYAHLDRYAEGIVEGREVARGTIIGYVGSTGNADPGAPHLHLAIFRLGEEKRWWEGTPINPYPVLMDALR